MGVVRWRCLRESTLLKSPPSFYILGYEATGPESPHSKTAWTWAGLGFQPPLPTDFRRWPKDPPALVGGRSTN